MNKLFSVQTLPVDKIELLLQKDYEFCYVVTNSLDDVKKVRQLCEQYNYIFTSTMGIKVLQLIKRNNKEGLEQWT